MPTANAAVATTPLADVDDSQPPALAAPGADCAHCSGTGVEPSRLALEFSRGGPRRGDLARLAASSGVSEATISRIASGLIVPSLPSVILIAHALGVSESRLIRAEPIWHRAISAFSE